jgi:hypothetical protein
MPGYGIPGRRTITGVSLSPGMWRERSRIPCVLKPEAYRAWLDPGNRKVHGLIELLLDACVKKSPQYNVMDLSV